VSTVKLLTLKHKLSQKSISEPKPLKTYMTKNALDRLETSEPLFTDEHQSIGFLLGEMNTHTKNATFICHNVSQVREAYEKVVGSDFTI
jgi:hypothetical protein